MIDRSLTVKIAIFTLALPLLLGGAGGSARRGIVADYSLFEDNAMRPVPPLGKWEISPYDPVISRVGEMENQDWRLLSAIACVESNFSADAVSRRGARGLMQIMPSVAASFGMAGSDIMNPAINVLLAARQLNRIERTLRFSAGTPESDRRKIILASYNAGLGHILDARRMAEQGGEDRNCWETVAKYLRMKSDAARPDDGAVRSGVFGGSAETIGFVERVVERYGAYTGAPI